MNKFFVTGGFGYIGCEFAKKALTLGHKVHLYDSLIYEQDYQKIITQIKEATPSSCHINLDYTIGDTRNHKLLSSEIERFEPTHLMHWGDFSSVYSCNHNPRLTYEVCYENAKNIIDLCQLKKIKLFINSSSSIYGVQKEKVLVKEDGYIPDPTDLYTVTKLNIEKYIDDKPGIICFRPATVYGASFRLRIDLLPNHFAWMAVNNGVIKVADLNAYRAAIHVSELCDAYLVAASAKNWHHTIYNIGSINITKLEFALGIQKITDCKIETMPDFGDMRNLQIDSSRFNNEFSFKPELDFSKSIFSTIKWMVDNKKSIVDSNYCSMLNMPLANWLKISE